MPQSKALAEKSRWTPQFQLGDRAPQPERAYTVARQQPAVGTKLAAGATIRLELWDQCLAAEDTARTGTAVGRDESEEATPLPNAAGQIVVPKLIGATAAEARRLLADRGLTATFRLGLAARAEPFVHRVYLQVPAAGTCVAKTSQVVVTFHDQAGEGTPESPAAEMASDLLTAVVVTTSRVGAGETVDRRSGQLLATATDLQLRAGPADLNVRRVLQLRWLRPGLLGHGWRLNWEKQLVQQGRLAMVFEGFAPTVFEQTTEDDSFRSRDGGTLQTDRGHGWVRKCTHGRREWYDAQGRLAAKELIGGGRAVLTYSNTGRLAKITGPFSSYLRFVTNQEGRLRQIESSTGVAVHYFYGSQSAPAEFSSLGSSIRYRYSVQGQLLDRDGPGLDSRAMAYDDDGRVLEMNSNNRGSWYYDYDDALGLQWSTAPDGGVTTTAIADRGRRVAITDGAGRTRATIYDESRRPVRIVTADGQATRRVYDALGRVEGVHLPEGRSHRIEYLEETRLPTRISGSNGDVIEYQYDNRLNLTAVRRGETVLRQATYDEQGLLKSICLLGARGGPSSTMKADAWQLFVMRRAARRDSRTTGAVTWSELSIRSVSSANSATTCSIVPRASLTRRVGKHDWSMMAIHS